MSDIEKMDLESKDLVAERIEQLKDLFPEIIVEGDGTIDFEKLRLILGDDVDEGQERYTFTWPGKADAIRQAQTPSTATLRPDEAASVDWDTTENLYIEGDNLEVLKLLQRGYHGKVKMIYIDPPYNTGHDFVYEDDFSDSILNYKKQARTTNQTNAETDGRFHSKWMSMLYPRLKLARELLSEDGLIFIHIDDNELENLGTICNEVFGDNNFINIITVKTKIGGVSGSSEGKSLKDVTEFIWVYAKDKNCVSLNPVYTLVPLFDRIKSYLDEGKSWKYTSIITKLDGKTLLKEDEKRGMKFFGYSALETQSVSSFARANRLTEEEVYNRYANKIFRTTNAQSSVRQTVIRETMGFDYPMYSCEYVPIKGKNEGQEIEVFYKAGSTDDQRNMVMLLSDVVKEVDGIHYYLDKTTSLWDDIDYNNLTKEGNIEFPNGKKPIKLLQRIIKLSSGDTDTIVDFFSGSASTAHATMQQNLKDGGNRKFIMIQLPEECEENSSFKKAGFSNICEIGEERIRRAGQKLSEDVQEENEQLKLGEEPKTIPDIGFRVLKLDSSNFEQVADGALIDDLIKPGRTNDDIIFEMMLKWGLELSLPMEKTEVAGYPVASIAADELICCMDEGLTVDVLEAIAALEPKRVFFLDSILTDTLKLNAAQIFKRVGDKLGYEIELRTA